MSEISVVQMTPEQLPELEKQMLADNHNVVMPTHVFRKEGEIIGSASLGAAPLVWWWMDSQKAKALDSVRSIKKLEDVCRSNGIRRTFVVCDTGSNFFPYIERLGNKFMWKTNIYYRDF